MAMPDQQKIMSNEHLRKMKAYCSDVAIKELPCARCSVHSSDEKPSNNSKNKNELIKLLSNVFTEHGLEIHEASDNADTMVAIKALNLSLNEDVEVKAEDTDILCILIHHFSENHKKL